MWSNQTRWWEASYHPTSLYQMRLLLAALAQIKAMEKIDHEKDFEVTAGGMADLIGATGSAGSYYMQLKRAADELMEMIVTVDKNPGWKQQKAEIPKNQRSEPLRLHRRRSQDRPAIHSLNHSLHQWPA